MCICQDACWLLQTETHSSLNFVYIMSFEKQQAIWLYSIIMALTAQRGLELGIKDMAGQERNALAELCA